MVHTMSTQKLEAEIKTRVPKPVKRAFEQLAKERHLDVADIAREAYREYLEKHSVPANKDEQKAVAA